MDIFTAIQLAEEYLYTSFPEYDYNRKENKRPIQYYKLNKSLQYYLCDSFNRLSKHCGAHSISATEIYLLIESWMMAKAAVDNLPHSMRQRARGVNYGLSFNTAYTPPITKE